MDKIACATPNTGVKAEFRPAKPIPSGQLETASCQKADSIAYQRQEETRTKKCFHPSGKFEKFPMEDVERSVLERFETIVGQFPDRVAVKMGPDAVTYAELNAQSNRVAHSLLDRRGPDAEPVALFFQKGVNQIASMLGVLKAGKFFVLLDVTSPRSRIADIMEDSQTCVIVSDRQNMEFAEVFADKNCSVIDSESMECGISTKNPRIVIEATAIANVRYTSGSTGKPKGVIQSHRGLLYQTLLYANLCQICAEDRISVLTANTGNTITCIFLALLNGAELLPFDVQREGVKPLISWLLRQKITWTMMSSPLFRNLCELLAEDEKFPDLRMIRLASEAAHKSDLDLYKKYFPTTCVLANALSSGETNLLTTVYFDHATELSGDELPVGYAVEGKDIFIKDNADQEVGFNQVGEIVVRSKYISPGYWNHPELTESKFKADPADPEKRIYYTGDLGVMLPNGCLIYKGRKDFRVKIRGFGVDLIEVEKALLSHDAVKEAVVEAHKSDTSEVRLIAFFTSVLKSAPSVTELRAFLNEKIPDYMIPAAFVKIDKIPLNANGKLDRKKLIVPDNSRPELATGYIAPRCEIEEKLAQIWVDILGISRIGIRDDFFEIGGHSLLAAKLFLRIDKIFGKQLSAATITYARTIEQLADIVRRDVKEGIRSLMVPIQPAGTKNPFFWACGFTSDIYLPQYLGPDQPVYSLLNQCHDGKTPLYTRLEDVATHHLKEIRSIQPEGPYYLGGFCFGGMVTFEIAQQLKRQGQEVALLFLVDLATLKNVMAVNEKIPSLPIETFGDKLARHIVELVKLKLPDKVRYVLVRLIDRATQLQSFVRASYYRAYLMSGQPVPPSLRLHHIATVDRKVLRNYQPQAYAGRIVHIKAKISTSDLQLVTKLTSGALEAYELPCRHGELIKEPYVSVWANQLKSHLQTAQGTSAKLPSTVNTL